MNENKIVKCRVLVRLAKEYNNAEIEYTMDSDPDNLREDTKQLKIRAMSEVVELVNDVVNLLKISNKPTQQEEKLIKQEDGSIPELEVKPHVKVDNDEEKKKKLQALMG